jgi:predicted adenine nucleotide alpha hydrolase (AANH) superfamily ATPase
LHACCAPCSATALERLSGDWEITLFYYNPNIYPEAEHTKRLGELRRLASEAPFARGTVVIAPAYDRREFLGAARGLENEPEGGARCRECFALRLRAAAATAAERGFGAFSTTLTTGPRKSAADINVAGEKASREYGAAYFAEDFKKRGGYSRSVELSREYSLYRQSYCGCEFAAPPLPRRDGARDSEVKGREQV